MVTLSCDFLDKQKYLLYEIDDDNLYDKPKRTDPVTCRSLYMNIDPM